MPCRCRPCERGDVLAGCDLLWSNFALSMMSDMTKNV